MNPVLIQFKTKKRTVYIIFKKHCVRFLRVKPADTIPTGSNRKFIDAMRGILIRMLYSFILYRWEFNFTSRTPGKVLLFTYLRIM